MLNNGTSPPSGVNEIMHRIDRAGARARGRRGEKRAHRGAETNFLAFHIAARGIDADRCQQRIAVRFGPIGDANAGDEHNAHGDRDRSSLPEIENRASKCEHGREGDNEDGPYLEHVGEGVGVFERMRGIGVKEAAAICAKLLDRLLARHWANGYDLLGSLKRRRFDRASECLRSSERDERKSDDDRQRQQYVERRAREIDPEIADGRRFRASEATHQRKGHGETSRCGDEIVNSEPKHLDEMTHCRLAAVVLPVGVGDEAHRRVEGEIGRNRIEALRIEWQNILQPLHRIER